MGSCLGKPKSSRARAHRKKGLSGSKQNRGKSASKASKPNSVHKSAEIEDHPQSNAAQSPPSPNQNLMFTKGSSMALPDAKDKLQLSHDPATQQIEEFFADPTSFEEELDNPVYMKIDRGYKVGSPIVYPPKMEHNMSFQLYDDADKTSVGVQVTFAYKSLAGRTEARGPLAPDKPNQDSVAVVRNKETPHRAIFGVFDGHGPYGEHASHFCRMELLKMYTIAKNQHKGDTPQQLLGHTLRYLDRKFASTDHRSVKVDPIVSGTTAVVIMLDGENIIAANVGDSRAILATRTGVEPDRSIKIEPLTDDHKPERPDERARIEASSAILLNEHEVRGGKAPAKGGPPGKTYICRHTNGEIVYGVLFTRSIGDVDAHRHLGVSSEPEFQTSKISEEVDNDNEQVIIIASDGVWDMMSNEECAEICLKSMDPLKACDEIVSKCAERWAKSGEGRRDDITVCVVGLGVRFGTDMGENDADPRSDRTGSYYGLL